jgi:hypothetical protein
MPGWLKVLLIIVALIVLLVVGVVGAGVYWWMKNKDALMARAKEVATEGRDFGRHTDNQGCVDESVSRYKKDPGMGSAISASLFIQTCLNASRPTPGFCTDVPKVTEFIKGAEWRVSQCRKVELSTDNYCQQLFQQVEEFCERGTRKNSENKNVNSY